MQILNFLLLIAITIVKVTNYSSVRVLMLQVIAANIMIKPHNLKIAMNGRLNFLIQYQENLNKFKLFNL